MDVDAVRIFDYLAGARGRIFEWIASLPEEAYVRPFPIGPGSIRATLLHVAAAEWAYVERLAGRDQSLSDSPFAEAQLPDAGPFARTWDAQAARTRASLAALGDPHRPVEFISRVGLRPVRALTTAGEIVLHMALHEVHHRAQVMTMLRRCGAPAENLDYSFLVFERTPLAAEE